MYLTTNRMTLVGLFLALLCVPTPTAHAAQTATLTTQGRPTTGTIDLRPAAIPAVPAVPPVPFADQLPPPNVTPYPPWMAYPPYYPPYVLPYYYYRPYPLFYNPMPLRPWTRLR